MGKVSAARLEAIATWQTTNQEKVRGYKRKYKAKVAEANRQRRPRLRTCPVEGCANIVAHKSGPIPRCDLCRAKDKQEQNRRAYERYKDYRKSWLAAKNAEYRWAIQIKSKYGITAEEWYRLLDFQSGKCALPSCTATALRPESDKKLATDHCYVTDLVRGLLCDEHNLIARRNVTPTQFREMADYLESPPYWRLRVQETA